MRSSERDIDGDQRRTARMPADRYDLPSEPGPIGIPGGASRLTIALLDEEAQPPPGTMDENADGELVFDWVPELPFTLTIEDRENMKGERVEICKPRPCRRLTPAAYDKRGFWPLL